MIETICTVRTACGCEKIVRLPWPPPPVLRSIIKPRIPISFNEPVDLHTIAVQAREFILVDKALWGNGEAGPAFGTALYEEKLEPPK
jgi:hypothetical protein